MPTYKLNKKCKVCGCKLLDSNKTGYCGKHRPRTGKDNPFYEKHHSNETKEHFRKTSSESTKKLWQNDEYRNKVISHATGVKRTDEFKETQRQNALKQYEDIHQHELRSKNMKQSWQEGKITKVKQRSTNVSKQEIKFFEMLSNFIDIDKNTTLSYIEDKKRKWLFPDAVIENIVVEYNGSFWHADPRIYKADDIIHHNISAQTIWDEDKRKKVQYEKLGYTVIYVWSKDFLDDNIKCVKDTYNHIKKLLNITH